MLSSTLFTCQSNLHLTHRKIILGSVLLLIALFIPQPSFAESGVPASDMKIMGSVLSQADHYRIRGENAEQHQQAIALYEQAAEQGSAVAQYWLGRMFYAGKGVEVDRDKAEDWLDLAAKQDYSPAKEFLFDVVLSDEVTDDEC